MTRYVWILAGMIGCTQAHPADGNEATAQVDVGGDTAFDERVRRIQTVDGKLDDLIAILCGENPDLIECQESMQEPLPVVRRLP